MDSNFARYYWLETTIDDTYAFGYPEDVTRGPTISDMTLQFVANRLNACAMARRLLTTCSSRWMRRSKPALGFCGSPVLSGCLKPRSTRVAHPVGV